MGDIKARTSLNEIEERLRRIFGLIGDVGAELSPGGMIPVVLADDATRPGANQRRGRAWGWSRAGGISAALISYSLRNTSLNETVVIEEVSWGYATNNGQSMVAGIASANVGVADPYAIATLDAFFCERMASNTDYAPLASGSGAVAWNAAAPRLWRLNGGSGSIPVEAVFHPRIALNPGDCFFVESAAAITGPVYVNVFGRIF